MQQPVRRGASSAKLAVTLMSLAIAGHCLLALVSSLGQCECKTLGNELMKAERLHHLVELLKVGGRPTVKDVVEAYREYVGLYELQSDLTDQFQKQSGSGSSSVESDYERISAILSDEGVHQISESLFSALNAADQAPDRLELTDKLRAQIQKSIDELQQ